MVLCLEKSVGESFSGFSKDPCFTTIQISVDGMHCKSCVRKIEDHFKEYKGVNLCKVYLDDAIAAFQYNSDTVHEKELAKEISNLGFAATLPNGLVYSKKSATNVPKLPPPPNSQNLSIKSENSVQTATIQPKVKVLHNNSGR